jgi:hypothetical protein
MVVSNILLNTFQSHPAQESNRLATQVGFDTKGGEAPGKRLLIRAHIR